MSKKESGIRTLLGDSEEEPKTTRSAALAQLAFERIGIFAAVFGFTLMLVKIMRVSHLNSRTAHALLSAVGPIEIVLGTLVTHFPTILFVISLLVTWWAMGSYAALRTLTPGHAAAAATLLFAVMLLPWPFVLLVVIVGAVRFTHRSSRPNAPRGRSGYYLLTGAAAVLLIVDAEPWLPPEVITMSDGTEVHGYAITEAQHSTGWLVALEENSRSVVHLQEADIAGREPCHIRDADLELEQFPSLLQITVRESTQLPEPECP
jgi:hypothetical protein